MRIQYMSGLLMDQSDENGFRLWLLSKDFSRKTKQKTLYQLGKFLREKKAINLDTASEWILQLLEDDVPRSTINGYIQAFKRWCRYKGEDWAFEFHKYKEERHIPQSFSIEEIKLFLSVHTSWDVFWQICILYGGRTASENLTLTIDQIDLGRQRILFQKTKTRKARSVPLFWWHVPILEQYTKTLHSRFLFASPRTGKPFTEATYMKDFRKRMAKVGITRPLRPYDFRGTAITRWLRKSKLVLFDVMRLVGHQNPNTTLLYYSDADDDELREGMETDQLVREMLPAQQQFNQTKEEYKKILVNEKIVSRSVSETDDELTITIKKKDLVEKQTPFFL